MALDSRSVGWRNCVPSPILWNSVWKTLLVLTYILSLNILPEKEGKEENVIQGTAVNEKK